MQNITHLKYKAGANFLTLVFAFLIAVGAGAFIALKDVTETDVQGQSEEDKTPKDDNIVYDYWGNVLYDNNTDNNGVVAGTKTSNDLPPITNAKYFTISWNGNETYYDENALRNTSAQDSDTTDLLIPDMDGINEKTTKFASQIISSQKDAMLYLRAKDNNTPTAIPLDLLTFSNPTLYFTNGNIEYEIKYISEDNSNENGLLAEVGEDGIVTTANTNTLISNSGYEFNADFNNNYDSGLQYSSLNIISRDVWGANTAQWDPYDDSDIDDPSRLSWTPYYYGFNRVIIHHTVSSNTYTDGAEMVRNIYKYHAYTRGWGDIGYNYLIDRFGNIYEAKLGGEGVYGYHAYSPANRMAIGISLIGDFTNQQPSDAMLNSLENLLAEKALLYEMPSLKYSNGALNQWTDTNYTVFGHRDSYFYCYESHPLYYLCSAPNTWRIAATACPGNAFWPNIGKVVTEAEKRRTDPTKFVDIRRVNSTLGSIGNGNYRGQYVKVKFDLPETATIAEVTSHIPDFSGISWYTIEGNVATLYVNDWEHSNGFVPPVGYTGPSYEPNSYFPVSTGPQERIEMLLRLFRLRDDVISADVDVRFELH